MEMTSKLSRAPVAVPRGRPETLSRLTSKTGYLHVSANSWRTMAGSRLAGVSRTRRRLSLPGRK